MIERWTVRFGARASLITATVWLVAIVAVAAIFAPDGWIGRVLVIGGVSLLPGAFALSPSPGTAWLAAFIWTILGTFGFVLYGLGATWLVAAACAFTGGVTESYRRRHAGPRAG